MTNRDLEYEIQKILSQAKGGMLTDKDVAASKELLRLFANNKSFKQGPVTTGKDDTPDILYLKMAVKMWDEKLTELTQLHWEVRDLKDKLNYVIIITGLIDVALLALILFK